MRALLYILLLTGLSLQSQDISKDFAMVNNYMAKEERLSVAINIVTKDEISNTIVQKQEGYYKRIKDLYVNKLNNRLVITDTNYVFLIDYARHYMSISQARNVGIVNKMISPEFITKMITICDTVIRQDSTKDIVTYIMRFSRTYKEVAITLNLRKKQVLRLLVHNYSVQEEGVKKEYVTTIKYSHYTTQVNKKDLSIYKYLQVQDGVLRPRPAYTTYQFVNMLTQ